MDVWPLSRYSVKQIISSRWSLQASHVEASGLSLCRPFVLRASGLDLAAMPRFGLAVLLPS